MFRFAWFCFRLISFRILKFLFRFKAKQAKLGGQFCYFAKKVLLCFASVSLRSEIWVHPNWEYTRKEEEKREREYTSREERERKRENTRREEEHRGREYTSRGKRGRKREYMSREEEHREREYKRREEEQRGRNRGGVHEQRGGAEREEQGIYGERGGAGRQVVYEQRAEREELGVGCPKFASKKVSLQSETKRNANSFAWFTSFSRNS